MLHNDYYNNYRFYNNNNNNMYYRPAPVFSSIEPNPIEDSDKTYTFESNFETNNTERSDEVINESTTSNKDRISLFGFSLNIDDIIIIGIVIFLFMENKKDYLLLIILGLMFFNISVDTFKNMKIFKQLFNPT